ncbi:tRNA modification GTPase MnmE [Rubripirellula lacrimiformis]|uniref:tRNA modification GTPase MnmE n=1 Tax=Rubripirellula lacrimiformis TaxID=1930273 RepID=A0A517NA68_9BACT|nr:tRNA modification GTPase [Rubripirellula lacrimiformis]QDT04027.1 tRNA modification GTPase MnmE [Rubripirellula lacrimiformis]
MWDFDETIVAIASPTSPAPRGIVRLSGTSVLEILDRMGISPANQVRPSRYPAAVDLGVPLGMVDVDVMVWPTPRSYTGQPSAELHTFGSLPLLTGLTELAAHAGARAARPGEFTMRAFLAGRLDLTQAEAVLGVIDAEGRGSLDHALRQLSGNLSKPLEQMRSTLLNLIADVEAGLDFVDEDIEFVSDETVVQRLTEISETLRLTAEAMRQRGGTTSRATIILRGEPNAGKSRLLNRLSESDTAIVADVAGTTRDVVTLDTTLCGHPVRWVDTAGIETGNDDISRESQDHARRASDEADVRLWCIDSSRSDFDTALTQLRHQAGTSGRTGVIDLFVATKCDISSLPTAPDSKPKQEPASDSSDALLTCSALSDDGIETLVQTVLQRLLDRDSEEHGSVVGTAARCGQSLDQAHTSVLAAIELTRHSQGHEFVSAEMRTAAQCLGEVTGAVYTDDILDRVFGRFCIGK